MSRSVYLEIIQIFGLQWFTSFLDHALRHGGQIRIKIGTLIAKGLRWLVQERSRDIIISADLPNIIIQYKYSFLNTWSKKAVEALGQANVSLNRG